MHHVWERYFGHISLATLVLMSGFFMLTAFLTTELSFTVASEPEYLVAGQPESVSAASYLIFDINTGEVIATKDEYTTRPIASVTKLMTALATPQVLPLDATTTITYADIATEGRAGKLSAGEVYSYRELRFPLLLESSNDAAEALSRASGGELVPQMNALAASFGSDATFSDASGLSDENTASAVGVAAFLQGIQKNAPQIFDITILPTYIGEYTGWGNNNPVFAQEGYQGGKHGFTNAANRTFAGIFEESFGGSTQVIGYVVLGSDDLAEDVGLLREFVATHVELR